jgi:hypothetical protein
MVTGLNNNLSSIQALFAGVDLTSPNAIATYVNNAINAVVGPMISATTSAMSYGGGDLFTALKSIPGVNIITSILASIVPGLDGSKITSGSIAQTFLNITSVAASWVTGILSALNIPGLDASKILTGFFSQAQITNLTTDLAARPATGTSANLAPNPNFVNSLSGWFTWGSIAPVWDGTQGHSANGSMKLVGASDEPGFYYRIPAMPGQTFTLSVWAKWSGITSGPNSGIYVEPQDSSNVKVTTTNYNTTVGAIGSGGWTQYVVSLTVPAGATQLAFGGWTSDNGTVWYDDVSMVQTNVLSPMAAPNALGGVQQILDTIKNSVDSLSGSGWSAFDLSNAVNNQTDVIAAQQAQIQALKSQFTSAQNSGSWTVDDFEWFSGTVAAHYTNQFLLNSATQGEMFGDGHNVGGRFNGSGGDWEQWLLYDWTGANTKTDNQKMTAVLANAFNQRSDGWGDDREIRLHFYMRNNTAETQWARWQIAARANDVPGTLRVQLQYKNGGAITNLGPEVGIGNLPAGTVIDSIAGQVGSPATFQLVINGSSVSQVVDGSSVIPMGVNNRLMGLGEGCHDNFAFVNKLAFPFLEYVTIQDNLPPATVGSGATICRTATSAQNISSGATNYVSSGTSFFDTTVRATPDIVPDNTWGGFSVTYDGWYSLKACVKIANLPDHVCLRLLGASSTTPSYARFDGHDAMRGLTTLAAATLPRWIGGEWRVYLPAGSNVYLGYHSDGAVSGGFTGEASGLECYFSIDLDNKSTL